MRGQAIVVAVVVVLMQLPKMLAMRYLQSGDIDVCSWLSFKLSFNKGIAWSYLSTNLWFGQYILAAIALGVLLLLAGSSMIQSDEVNKKIFFIVSLGAFGNIVDRLMYGHVIDYIDLHWGAYHWPTFNIPDILIVVGLLLIVARMNYDDIERPN